MTREKQTCKILKEIRRQIAEANGIEFATQDCRYKGDCSGTCPKCEAEVRYLEQQLHARSIAGKAIALAGISAGMIFMSGCNTSKSDQSNETSKNEIMEVINQIDWLEEEEVPDESVYAGFAQPLFSVERIGKDDFDKARNSPEKYVYNLFSDSVVENNTTHRIIQDVKTRFENMDSRIRMDKYYIDPDSEEYRDLFSSKSLILAKEHRMYGFILPDLHYYEMYCYDLAGKFLGNIIMPFAISPSGIMVAQKDDDCDVSLDLHFYKRVANYVSEFLSFKDSSEPITYMTDYFSGMENNLPYTSFWIGDDLLFISFQSPSDFEQTTYLRISISKKDSHDENIK